MCLLAVVAALAGVGVSCRKSAPPPEAPPPASAPMTATTPASAPVSAPAESQAVSTVASAPAHTDDYDDLMARGNAAVVDGDYPLAAHFYTRAVKAAGPEPGVRRGDKVEALKGLSNVLTLLGRHDQAAEAYRRLVEMDPSDRTGRFNLAVSLVRIRRFGEAEGIYLHLVTEQPDFVQARYNLAWLYQVEGKLAQARDQWRQVVRQAPQLASAHAALGDVLMHLGDVGQAMAAYLVATDQAADNASLWHGLTLAARAAGYPQHAVVAARRAAELDPQDAAAWRLLGDVLLDLHRATRDERFLTQAATAWRRSLALDDTQDDLRRILAATGGSRTTAGPPPPAASAPAIDN